MIPRRGLRAVRSRWSLRPEIDVSLRAASIPRVPVKYPWKNVVKNSGTTVKNKTKKIARSSISYTIYLFFAVFWGCHCIWASASVRGHPREKHLVYVVVAGSRATQCRKRGSKRIPSRRDTAKNHEKRHAIVFFGAVSSRSGHRSVGYHRPCGRR